jgi:hypothetical protein
MRRSRVTQAKPLVAGLLLGLLLVIVAVPLGAQPAHVTGGEHFGPYYDRAHEVTINGVVEEVVTKRVAGSPVGMHLLIGGQGGVVDAHVGPFLAKDVMEGLHAGLPVQIVGAMQDVRGKQYLMARQLVFGGRTVTVRNKNGFLARSFVNRAARPASQRAAQTEQNGGAR